MKQYPPFDEPPGKWGWGDARGVAILAVAALVFGTAGYIIYMEETLGPKTACVETSPIVSIDSIVYRGGLVTLADGSTLNVGQPTRVITVGVEICTKWEKQW